MAIPDETDDMARTLARELKEDAVTVPKADVFVLTEIEKAAIDAAMARVKLEVIKEFKRQKEKKPVSVTEDDLSLDGVFDAVDYDCLSEKTADLSSDKEGGRSLDEICDGMINDAKALDAAVENSSKLTKKTQPKKRTKQLAVDGILKAVRSKGRSKKSKNF